MHKPAKLLMALIFGLSTLTLATAYADDGHGNSDNSHGNSDNSHGNDGGGDQGSSGSSTASCTGTVVSACGIQVVKSVCTGSSSARTDDDPDENSEHQDGEGDNRGGNSDSHGHHYSDDDRTPPPSGTSGSGYDFDYTDSHGARHHVDHSQRMGSSPDGKLTICHREGGARVTLNVPDDQVNGFKAHGHGKHDFDTLGRCEDQDDGEGRDDPRLVASAVKLSPKPGVTPSLIACLTAPAGTPVTVTLPNGTTWSGTAPGIYSSGSGGGGGTTVSISIPSGGTASGGSLPNSGAPNRGGVRTLR